MLEAGADPLRANDYGHTPLDYANDSKAQKLLKHYAEKMEERRKLEERVVEGVHEVGVVDWRLGPWVINDQHQ